MKHDEVMRKIVSLTHFKDEKEIQIKMIQKGAVSHATGKPYCALAQLSLDVGEYVTASYVEKHHLKLKDDARVSYLYNPICGCYKSIVHQNKKVELVNGKDDDGEVVVKKYFRSYKETPVYEVGMVEGLERKHEILYHEDMLRMKKMDAEKHSGTYKKICAVLNRYLENNKVYATSSGLFNGRLGYCSFVDRGCAMDEATCKGIHVPSISHFHSPNEFFSVSLHEVAHSTAEKLGREIKGRKGTIKYAIEECVAELTSLKLMQHFKISTKELTEHSIAYINRYANQIKRNREKTLVGINKMALQAAEYILGKELHNQKDIALEGIFIAA